MSLVDELDEGRKLVPYSVSGYRISAELGDTLRELVELLFARRDAMKAFDPTSDVGAIVNQAMEHEARLGHLLELLQL